MLETKHNCPIMFKDIDSNDQLMFCLESKTCIPCPMNDVENRVLFCSNIIIKCLTNVSQCCVFVFMAIVYLFVYGNSLFIRILEEHNMGQLYIFLTVFIALLG